MSFEAMAWAVRQECGSSPAKLVLLMLANHSNGHTGQCNPRMKTLAGECEMRPETLRNHVKALEDRGLLTVIPQYAEGVQLPNQYRLNLHSGGCEIQGGGGGDFRVGGGGDFRPPNKQEDKQEDKHPHTPKGADALFDTFWTAYPVKVGKDAAKRAFTKRKPTAELLGEMLNAIAEQKTSLAWIKEDGQFIPHPATWLNQGRWMDEVPGSIGAAPVQSTRLAGAI